MKEILNFEKYFEGRSPEKDLEVIHYDIPDEVKKTSLKILHGMFDKVKDVTFYVDSNGVPYVEFGVNEEDFKFIEPSTDLEMDVSDGVRRKRHYDVTLKFNDKFEDDKIVLYEIYYGDIEPDTLNDIEDEDEDGDVEVQDTWYDPIEDDDVEELDDDTIYKNIDKKNKKK